MLPIVLICGFLGAGKTTFLRRALLEARARNLRIWVIVNEFGAIDVDGALLRAANVENLAAISGGCACCVGEDEFVATLLEWAQSGQKPDAIWVESSGLADPAALLETLLLAPLSDFVRVAAIAMIADASRWNELETVAPFLNRQLALADFVALNKADLLTPDELKTLQIQLQKSRPDLQIAPCIAGEIDFSPLFAALETSKSARKSNSNVAKHPDAKSRFCALPHPIEGGALQAFLNKNSLNLWRAKGFVRLRGESGIFLVQMSGGAPEITPFSVRFGDAEPNLGLVFIAPNLPDDFARKCEILALSNLF